MTLILGREFPADWSGYPPRMSEEDFQIWQRWWPTVKHLALRMWFDVGLGGGQAIPEGTGADLAYMWTRNTQKRADAIIETADSIWLVELRFAAQPNAIGRLLTYRDLLVKEHRFNKPIRPTLVTNREDPEVRETAQNLGIAYEVI